MDLEFRALGRTLDYKTPGDLIKLALYADREGHTSLFIWRRALSLDPKSEDARLGYIGAGGFYAEPIRDPYLGSAWKLYNLPVTLPNGERTKYNLIYGRKLFRYKNHRIVKRTADHHLEHSVAGPEENPGGVAVASTLVKGCIDRAMLVHKDAPFLKERVAEYQNDELEKEQRKRIVGKLTYGFDQATLEDIALDRTRHSRTVIVPMFSYNFLALAPEQPEDYLGTMAPIPYRAIPLLIELFGKDYVRIIPAIQYFTKRRGGNLAAVYLWTAPLDRRTNIPERSLVLVSYEEGITLLRGNEARFCIGCEGGIGDALPVCGWRSAQKICR
ncbi:hypothetical protein HY489_01365 [Candidatus Woesearchaeota archaeon]|nr:hypothetical protein [Candidatus Woesearchaeota archaeon]